MVVVVVVVVVVVCCCCCCCFCVELCVIGKKSHSKYHTARYDMFQTCMHLLQLQLWVHLECNFYFDSSVVH